MCAKYHLHDPRTLMVVLKMLFEVDEDAPAPAPDFHVRPTDPAPVVRLEASRRAVLESMRWGWTRPWSRGPLVNATADGGVLKRTFAPALESRRCLVPATGYYEYREEQGVKRPYDIHLVDAPVFAFAGLWEPEPEGTRFVVLTTAANALAGQIHDRMPAILPAGPAWRTWLDPDARAADLAALLAPIAADRTQAWPVDRRLGRGAHDDAGLVTPVGPPLAPEPANRST